MTLHLADSLLKKYNKYDSIRIDVFVVDKLDSTDTLYRHVAFHGPYLDSSQLVNMNIGKLPSHDFVVVLIAYRAGVPALILGFPFSDGKVGKTDTIQPDTTRPRINRPPYFVSGTGNGSMSENQTKTFVIKAKDDDNDPLVFTFLNRDSLRALFSDTGAITAVADKDSLTIIFKPGNKPGNYPFRIQVRDTATSALGTLNVTVGNVNRPPEIHFGGADSGKTVFTVKEGDTLSLRILASDLDAGDHAALQALQNPPSSCGAIGYDTLTGDFSFRPSFACVDTVLQKTLPDLQFTARDTGGLVSSITARITVLDSNSAPKWKASQQNLAGKEGKAMTLRLDSLFTGDAENDSLTFTSTLGTIAQNPLTWNFTPAFSDSGKKTCVITVQDSHHPPLSGVLTLNLTIADSVRPVDVVITSPVNGTITRDTVIAVAWKVNGAVQNTKNLDTLRKEGPNGIKRSFQDSLGGFASDSITVYRDRTPPGKPLVTSPGLTNNPTPRWTWRSGGNGFGYFRFKLDTANLGSDTVGIKDTTFTPAANLSEGRHTLYIQERDSVGNWSATDSGVARIDVTKPLMKITSPGNNAVTRQTSIDVFYTVDSVAQTKVTKSLSEGSNVLTVTGTDSAGNKDSASVTVIRDTQAPSKPQVTGPGLTKNQKPTWTWRSGGNGGAGYFRFKVDDKNLTDTVGLTDTSFAPAANLSEGNHMFFVQERDVAGNWSPMDSTGLARIDITPPVVTIQSPADSLVTNQATVQVAWKIDGVTQTPVTKNLTEGVNTITQSSTDSAGNMGSASITVTRRSNVVFVNAATTDTAGDGNSWAKPYRFLQTALARAASGQEVWVAKGMYKPAGGVPGVDTNTFDTSFVMKTGVVLYGGFVGKENAQGLRDWKVNESVLSGERGDTSINDNAGPIVVGANNATLDGFVVERGYATLSFKTSGMSNSFVSPKIFNCNFRNNKNDNPESGATAISNLNSYADIQNCSFIGNHGRYVEVVYNVGGSPTFSKSTFQDNQSYSGTITSTGESFPKITGCLFIGNRGSAGSAISNSQAKAVIRSNIFINNSSSYSGGAIFSPDDTIENCVFANNQAESGGAIHVVGTPLIRNNTFFSNRATNFGGAVFYANRSGNSRATIENSIFWNNTSSAGGNDIGVDTNSSNTDTLQVIYSEYGGVYPIGGMILLNGPGNISSYPSFLNTSDFAGSDGRFFTGDDGLSLYGGPCVNSGNPTPPSGISPTDITGVPRVQSSRIDMGAYEQ